MKWGCIGLSVLCVAAVSGCGGSKAPEPSGTVATAPPRTVVATTIAVTSTSTVAASTTSTSVVLGPGPTDAEIQAILDDNDRRTAEIFAAFKKTLVITPEIDAMIVDSFGPGAERQRRSLRANAAVHGKYIRQRPLPPKSNIEKIMSRSSECLLVRIKVDLSPMLDQDSVETNELFGNVDGRWYLILEVTDEEIVLFEGHSCDLG